MPELFAAPSPQTASQPEEKNQTSGPMKPFTAFALRPAQVTFENQNTSEQVVAFLRRHFITNITWVSTTVILFLLPLLFFVLITIGNINLTAIPQPFLFFVLVFYYLLIGAYAFVQFIGWFFNVGIITTDRVIDIDVSDITSKQVTTAALNSVENVQYTQGGFLKSFFNYGDVSVETEESLHNLVFESVPNPAKVADVLIDLKVGVKNGN